MSLFSRLRAGRAGPDTTTAKAVLTPAVSTMIADGSISEAELAQLTNVVSFNPIFFPIDQDTLHKLIKAIIDEIGQNGHPATIEAAAGGLSQNLRETAFCFAARIALADGHLDDGEKNSLVQTGHYMHISEETFGQILGVVAMMQRGPNA